MIDFLYGHNGIAIRYPEQFSVIFPITALALGCSIMRITLREHRTGRHITKKLDSTRQKGYFHDLKVATNLANPQVDKYHAPIIDTLLKSLASRGRARLTTGPLFDDDILAKIVDNLSHIRFDIPTPRLGSPLASASNAALGNNEGDPEDAVGEMDPDRAPVVSHTLNTQI
ncbi:hypothetical protein HWV62_43527 [Athelia sp. TMB]|nr:hypothetical protein HWV62_43527 [Athelia sp. TMB]